jgi:threonyl-tRNA synthetase
MSEHNTDANQLSRKQIFWERIKRPMVLIATCLIAAVVLFLLQQHKIDFDKNESAPLIIVDQINEKDVKYLREGTATVLTIELVKNIERVELIPKIVNGAKYQTFKNEDELITGLFTSLASIKEKELKSRNDDLNQAIKAKNRISEQKANAEKQFSKFEDEEKNKVLAITKESAAKNG